jgi:hypothetical protein
MRRSGWLVLAIAVGCHDKGNPCLDGLQCGDTDADTDADSDADVDTDSDSDSDADTDATPVRLDGTLTFVRTVGGVQACDEDVDVRSTGVHAGDCPGCDFAFDVTATVSRDDSTGCVETRDDALLTWREGFELTDRWLAFGDGPIDADTYLANAVLAGHGDAYEYAAGALMEVFPYDGNDTVLASGPGRAWHTGDDLEIDLLWSVSDATFDPYGSDAIIDARAPDAFPSSGAFGDEDLGCDLRTRDVWQFTGREGPVTVAVDTTRASSVGDLDLHVIDGSRREWGYADQALDCTYGLPEWHDAYDYAVYCPGATRTLAADEAGATFLAVVEVRDCGAPGRGADYRLMLSGGDGLVLLHDDSPFVNRTVTTIAGHLSVPTR